MEEEASDIPPRWPEHSWRAPPAANKQASNMRRPNMRAAASARALPRTLEPASPAAAPWRRRPRTSPHAPPEAHQRFFWVWAAIKTDLYWKLRAGDLRRSSRAQYRRVFVLNISGGRTFLGFGDPKQRTCTGIFPPVFVFRGVA